MTVAATTATAATTTATAATPATTATPTAATATTATPTAATATTATPTAATATTATPTAGDLFGGGLWVSYGFGTPGVAVSGDVLVVGAAGGDQAGTSVAIDGEVIAAGANTDDVGGASNQGSVSVFRFDGASWFEEQQLTHANGSAYDGITP